MSVIIFLIILSALIFVHELGHFLAAKRFGVRVDEFGLGYPPRAKKLFSWKGTEFTLNWLPFGGFVRIFGENPTDPEVEKGDPTSFVSKRRDKQAIILVAGVVGNLLFAWFLISLGFMTGVSAPTGLGFPVSDPQTVITTVLPGSPADVGGLKSGDIILSMKRADSLLEAREGEILSPDAISGFIALEAGEIEFEIKRGQDFLSTNVYPQEGIIAGKRAVGISMDVLGTAKLSPHKALWYGLISTVELTVLTAKAIVAFFSQVIVGQADLSSVTGPVGLVGMVGDVQALGWSYILSFTAIISINLAIINLLPFPALDGGRLLFVGIETITRRALPAKVFNLVNALGFALLVLLMVIITVRDIKYIL